MMGSGPLSETTSWNQSNTSIFQNLQAIEKIRRLFSSSLYDFFGEFNLRECIHSTFYVVSSNIFHTSKSFSNKLSSKF